MLLCQSCYKQLMCRSSQFLLISSVSCGWKILIVMNKSCFDLNSLTDNWRVIPNFNWQIMFCDKWIKLVNFKLSNKMWKVNWSMWLVCGTKKRTWVPERNGTHDFLDTDWVRSPLSYENSRRAGHLTEFLDI